MPSLIALLSIWQLMEGVDSDVPNKLPALICPYAAGLTLPFFQMGTLASVEEVPAVFEPENAGASSRTGRATSGWKRCSAKAEEKPRMSGNGLRSGRRNGAGMAVSCGGEFEDETTRGLGGSVKLLNAELL